MHLPDDHPKFDLHPDRLRSLALLFGLTPPNPVETAHIVLLGVSHGANALALACEYPNAQICAVASTAFYAQRLQNLIKHLKLKNLRIFSTDKWLEYQPKIPIDYLLCHGYYSYLNAAEKKIHTEHIAKIIHPQGMIYIDYLTQPGWQAFENIQYLLSQVSSTQNLQNLDVETFNQNINLVYKYLHDQHPLRHNINHIVPKMDFRTHPSLNGYWALKQAHAEKADDFVNRLQDVQLGYLCDSDIGRYYFNSLPEDIRQHCGADTHLYENIHDLLTNQASRASIITPITQLIGFYLPNYEDMLKNVASLHIAGHFQLSNDQTTWHSTLNSTLSISATQLNSVLIESINHVYHADNTLSVAKMLQMIETKFKSVPDIQQSASTLILNLILSGSVHIRSERQHGFQHQALMLDLYEWTLQNDASLKPANKWLQALSHKEIEIIQITEANA